MATFKPIDKTSISSEIVSQIAALVDSGDLKPGDRIPPERTLCEMFGVGRGSVREAIKVLEATGTVERRGKAVLVSEKTPAMKLALDIADTIDDIRNVMETRNIMEIESCRLAAKRAGEQDIEKLSEIISRPATDYESFSSCDRAFHRTIMEASHNPVLLQVYDQIADLIFRTEDLYRGKDAISREEQQQTIRNTKESHQEILDAIRSRDPQRAVSCAKKHLKAASAALIAQVQAQSQQEGSSPAAQ